MRLRAKICINGNVSALCVAHGSILSRTYGHTDRQTDITVGYFCLFILNLFYIDIFISLDKHIQYMTCLNITVQQFYVSPKQIIISFLKKEGQIYENNQEYHEF